MKRTFFTSLFFLFSIATSAETPRIEWRQDSLQLVQKDGCYGRIIRLDEENVLCCFEWQGQIWVRQSPDNGHSWEDPVVVTRYSFGNAANPELLLLQNGTVLCFYNERPADGLHPFQITYCKSRDQGQTWSPGEVLYTADKVMENGCWEPAAIQLPSGEIQVFFANENPYRSSNEQEITLIRGGSDLETWKEPQKVSFRAGFRDGMPVPFLLQDKQGIVVAIEDNGYRGEFKPMILHTSLEKNWESGFIDGKSPDRRPALRNELAPSVYAGAPYIRQMPNGETVLSFQTTEGKHEQQIVVYVGDCQARNFEDGSFPFDLPENVASRWGSLFVKGPQTITVVGTTTIHGEYGVWVVDGVLK